jgi:drug/metabolite transporter (DMT)-like permease
LFHDRSADPAVAGPRARSRLTGVALVAIAALSWGTWSLYLRPTHLPATVTAPILFLVMGLVTLPLALRGAPTRWDRITIGLVVANAAFDAVNVLTFFGALAHTTVAIAVLTHYLAPILIALVASRLEGVVTRGAGPAAAVALTGLVIILEPWRAPSDGAIVGALLGAASAVCYAGNVFTVRRLAARIGVARALSYHSLLAAAVLAPLAVSGLGDLTAQHLALLVCGSVTNGAFAGLVFALGLLRIGSARAAILTFIDPIVAVALGALVWGEPLHPIAMLGAALVVGAGIEVARKAR